MYTILRTLYMSLNNCAKPIVQQASYHFITQNHNLLRVNNPFSIPSCGFKVKAVLKRRCKDCYFVKRENRLFVICNTHRRHKQMQMVKKEKNTWILSHATQGKIRPW